MRKWAKWLAFLIVFVFVGFSFAFSSNNLLKAESEDNIVTEQIEEHEPETKEVKEENKSEPVQEVQEKVISNEEITEENTEDTSVKDKEENLSSASNNEKEKENTNNGHYTIHITVSNDSNNININDQSGDYAYWSGDETVIKYSAITSYIKSQYPDLDIEDITYSNVRITGNKNNTSIHMGATIKEVKPEPVVEYGKYKITYVDENGIEIRNSFVSEDIDISKSPVDISSHIVNIDGYDRIGETPSTVNLEADKTTEIVITYKAKKPEIIEIAVIALGQTPGHSITVNRQKGETLSDNPMDYDNLTLIVGRYNREPITDSAILNAIKYQLSYTESWNVDDKDFVSITPSGEFKQGPDGNYHVFYESGLIRLGAAPTPPPVPVTYTITWDNGYGGIIKKDIVNENDLPVAPDNPKRPDDEDYTYEFIGWDKTIIPATEDTTYVAQYKATPKEKPIVKYTLTIHYIDENKQSLIEDYVKEYAVGEAFSIESPIIEGYEANISVVNSGDIGMPEENLEFNVVYTKILPPEPPTDPTEPTEPTKPSVDPTEPTQPTIEPTEPTEPTIEPTEPTDSTKPTVEPTNPINPTHPGNNQNNRVTSNNNGVPVILYGMGDGDEYSLVSVENPKVSLADNLLDRECCILHLLIMILAALVLIWYTHDAKKLQRKIKELEEELGNA